jgi:hypothetical protein
MGQRFRYCRYVALAVSFALLLLMGMMRFGRPFDSPPDPLWELEVADTDSLLARDHSRPGAHLQHQVQMLHFLASDWLLLQLWYDEVLRQTELLCADYQVAPAQTAEPTRSTSLLPAWTSRQPLRDSRLSIGLHNHTVLFMEIPFVSLEFSSAWLFEGSGSLAYRLNTSSPFAYARCYPSIERLTPPGLSSRS